MQSGQRYQPPDEIRSRRQLQCLWRQWRRGDDAGWYVLHDDSIPAGCFEDWRTGSMQTWRADIETKPDPEEAAHRARIEAMGSNAGRRSPATGRSQQRAATIWQGSNSSGRGSSLPDSQRYQAARRTLPQRGKPVIPMRDGGEIHSLQFIGPDGDKRFLTGGRVSGAISASAN